MDKVGIITLYGNFNYGNRLQNYAVQKIITDLGFQAVTYTCEPIEKKIGRKKYIKWRIHELTNYRLKKNRDRWKIRLGRYYAFQDFTKKYIPTIHINSLDGLTDKADYFVIGSDQVWNPIWYQNLDKDLFLLTFARSEQKICFAPSFGSDHLPTEWETWFRVHLQTFPSLSVREQQGANIIRELTGRTAEVLLDPTLMLDESDWRKIARKPCNIDTRKPYILTYFLGDFPHQAEVDIEKIQSEKKRTVYHLLDKNQPDVYACGPREFLYMILKAEIVLTDSFHACVFSFIFNRPFVVYDRGQKDFPNMNSRLETLLSSLSLQRKYRNSGLENDPLECGYDDGIIRMNQLRIQTKRYLKECMHVN